MAQTEMWIITSKERTKSRGIAVAVLPWRRVPAAAKHWLALGTTMNMIESLQARYADLARRVSAGDAKGAGSLYMEDAQLMPQGASTLVGRSAITGFYSAAFAGGVAAAKFTVLEAHGDESSASYIGRFEIFARTEEGLLLKVDGGRNHGLWRKDAGVWKLHRDIFNRETEPAKSQ